MKLTITSKGLDSLITEINQVKVEMDSVPGEILEELLSEGERIMSGNIDMSEVADSVTSYVSIVEKGSAKGYISAEHESAVYLEYGTGIVGVWNPHPELPIGWVYDINEHGYSGWVYWDSSGRKRWTMGLPSNQFILKTREELQREAGDIAIKKVKELFK